MKTPHDALEACWDLAADLRAAGTARRLAREVLTAWGMSALVEDVTVVVSELVGNALVHGRAPITLSLHRHGRIVRGEVTDHGAMWPTPLPACSGEEHGRGLTIVAACADRWGVEPAQEGKTVWFVCAEWRSR
ncbi:ATP-binding protein [Sphaerisporangium sp. NPDC051017]|uniref:ATP-binding protein n=1 Tax=Sphaerisporangium sp. NPDC051017 TaxID=3154636 RepID=UPI0034338D66